MLVVIDHQNIHLTGHDRWAPQGVPVHRSLIHPLSFADQMMQVRQAAQQDQLSNRYQPQPYAA